MLCKKSKELCLVFRGFGVSGMKARGILCIVIRESCERSKKEGGGRGGHALLTFYRSSAEALKIAQSRRFLGY